jgi:virginiamycin B lyase
LAGVLLPGICQAQSNDLPDGTGKHLVESLCTACHRVRNIQRSSGYTKKGWSELIATMVDVGDAKDHDILTTYLATNFPVNDRRMARPVKGSASVTFREWVVPTLGQRARDPIEAADGMIWWAGQWGNLIGRINPKTGAMKEWPLPADAKPHSVFADRQGHIWYTGNGNGTIGRFDPKTETIKVFAMPDPKARDPHTAVVDKAGIIWFTMQLSNMVGRLDPATGGIRVKPLPTPNSRPYGIKLDKSGGLWIACNGSNRLVHVDPGGMAIREYPIPDPKSKIRRLDIAPDGMIWYVNSARGRIGRLDPDTGKAKEWPSPSGPKSHPYAIAVVNGVIWYNESGVRPDMLVRFDPKSETFQSWPIPSGSIFAGIVRHLDVTRNGNLLIHQSATNRIIHVTLPPAN